MLLCRGLSFSNPPSRLGSHGCSALMLASTAPLPRHCSALGRKVYWHGDVIRANGHCNSSLVAKSAIITQFLCRVGECPSSLGFQDQTAQLVGSRLANRRHDLSPVDEEEARESTVSQSQRPARGLPSPPPRRGGASFSRRAWVMTQLPRSARVFLCKLHQLITSYRIVFFSIHSGSTTFFASSISRVQTRLPVSPMPLEPFAHAATRS